MLASSSPASDLLRAGCVYVNGAFVAPADAVVSAFDHGYLYGDGLFETLRCYEGAPFRLAEHLQRLAAGLRALAFPPLPALAELETLVRETLRRAAIPDAYLRITVTRGISAAGLDPAHCRTPTIMIAALPGRAYPDAAYRDGVTVTLLWQRSRDDRPPPSVKTTSFQRGVLARAAIAERGAFEGLYLDEIGNVTEGSVSNVFARYGATLVTPPAVVCLPGITRSEVITIARDEGLTVTEEELSATRLLTADEIFITSSLAELVPVTRVDHHHIGDGLPGSSQLRLRHAYLARARQGATR